MHKHLNLALRLSSSAMVFSGYLALASVSDYGGGVLLIPAVLIALAPIGEYLDGRFPIYREVFKAITIIYCAFIPFTWFVLGALNSVVALTIYIQCNLMLHRKEERFYHYIFLMAFFLLLAASVQSPEALIGLAMIAFLVSTVWSFITLRLQIESRASSEAAAAELLPLHSRGMTPEEGERSGFDGNVVMNMVLVSLASVLLTVALFMFTPRLEAGILGRSNNVVATTGLSEEVDLRGGAYVREDATAVMLIRFPDIPDGKFPESELYWRNTTFPKFYNSKWSRYELNQNLEPHIADTYHSGLRSTPSSMTEVWRQPRPEFELVHQVIYMDRVPEEGVPCLDLIQSMSIDSDQSSTRILWDRDEDFTINYRAPTGPRRLYYEAWSEVGEPTPEQLQTSSDDYTSVPDSDFRTLTDHELRDSTQAFVRELTRDAATVYDKAVAIQTWLSGPDFLYSLNLPELPPDYAVDAFIMQTRKGHCELFASAMALMLRSLGVPTRVVSGYRGGEWNDTDGTYMVRQYMAHLWVEVYFPDVGWVRFDPSPSDANFIDRVGKFRRMLSTYILKSKMFWYQEVIGFAGAFQLAKLREFSMGVVGGFLGQDRVSGGTSPTGSRIRVGPIIGMIGLIGLATLILLRGRNANGHRPGQWWTLTQDQTRATRLYERLRRKLAKSGADCYGKTAEELRADLEENRWIEVVPAVRLLQIYCDVRFGGRPLLKAQYQELLAELKRLHPLKK